MPRVRNAGFAMLDVLVALLLLAVALTGACATLVQTMRATQGALLATRAVDLAADFSEQLRGVTTVFGAETLLAAWREQVRAELPVSGLEPERFAALAPTVDARPAAAMEHFALVLRWRDMRTGGLRELNLPLAWQATQP